MAGRFEKRWSRDQERELYRRTLDPDGPRQSVNAAARAMQMPYSTAREKVNAERERRTPIELSELAAGDTILGVETVCKRGLTALEREMSRLDAQAAATHELDSRRIKELFDASVSIARTLTILPRPKSTPTEAGEPDESRPASSLVAALEDAGAPQPRVEAATEAGRPAPSTTPGSGEHGQGNGGASGQGVIVRASDLAAELEAERARAS